VLCENLPTGASGNPAPDSNPNLISPISSDGTRVPTDNLCNASTEELISRITGNAKVRQVDCLPVTPTEKCALPECPNPLPPAGKGSPQTHKFCSKKHATLSRVRRLRAKTAPLRALKVPIANDYLQEKRHAGAGLRDAGRYSVAMAARQRKETITALRAESKKKRDDLKRQNKELTIELNRLIAEADAVYDKVVAETGIALVTPKKGSL
jgi:hypothetical protein